MTIKLQAGKAYKMRNGERVMITYSGKTVYHSADDGAWDVYGKCLGDEEFDIISEWEEPSEQEQKGTGWSFGTGVTPHPFPDKITPRDLFITAGIIAKMIGDMSHNPQTVESGDYASRLAKEAIMIADAAMIGRKGEA